MAQQELRTPKYPLPAFTLIVTVDGFHTGVWETAAMPSPLDRRRFHELSAAALGGLVAGTLAGCGSNGGNQKPVANKAAAAADTEKHLCRGLNECKGQGASGKNDCRGQGDCATIPAHECGGRNDCKGQGGCGPDVALNECKGKGGCHVPLMESAWETVRKRTEAAWTETKQLFGQAPEKM
jgi:hypothetical protein